MAACAPSRGAVIKTSEPPVIVEEIFDAARPTVWRAITVLEEMREWYFDNIPAFEARVGFETEFLVTSEAREFLHRWRVSEVVPGRRIAYEWRFREYPGLGVVVFELEGAGAATKLKLTNTVLEDFPADVPEFEWDSCLAGWRYFIGERLKEYLLRSRQPADSGP